MSDAHTRHERSGFARWIAAGFGSGYAPIAPGTFGSIVGAVLGAGLLISGWSAPTVSGGLLVAAAVAAAAGWWAIPRASDGDDHGWIVIDEIAGQLLALIGAVGLHGARLAIAAGGAFLLFRAFDIAKPGPIGWVDRRHGATGIMGDDLLAGIAAAIALGALREVVKLAGWGA